MSRFSVYVPNTPQDDLYVSPAILALPFTFFDTPSAVGGQMESRPTVRFLVSSHLDNEFRGQLSHAEAWIRKMAQILCDPESEVCYNNI